MAFVGEFEVVDDLPHLLHLLDHPAGLGDGTSRIVGAAREEDRGPDPVQIVDWRELAVQVRVRVGVAHLLAVVSAQVAALVRRRGEPVEVSDDAHADRPQFRSLFEDMGDRVPAVADADDPEALPWEAPVLAEPPAARNDVLHVAAPQIAVAQPAPRPPVSRPPAVVRGEDREPLREHELEPRPPFVHGLRLGAPVGIDDRGVAAAPLPPLEEPRRDLTTIAAPVPDQFAIHELGGWQLSLQAGDERRRPPASPKEETVRLRERGVVAEETGTIGMPSGVAPGGPVGGDRPGARYTTGNCLTAV